MNSKSIEIKKQQEKSLMNDGNAKQQIAEKVKNSSNIMVTVSTNPSVDELSAALGLTLLLNKMNKHATAVFSGDIPPAITFLDPQKTFENTVDSLRDFIIALDKEKADHLRYKVDGDVVKIFITPYRTTITSDDLDFSQGDYNVELVLALGVKNRDDLDNALSAHGRILHDATVVSVSAGAATSELGSINWREENASSLSEMLVSLADAFKNDKGALDEQIATAFLTGIVAATDRFSNDRTSSKVMTIAAQLMSAGANQQLIASKLEEAHEIGDTKSSSSDKGSGAPSANSDGTTDLTEGESTKVNRKQAKSEPAPEPEAPKKKADDGSLTISHEKQGDLDEVSRQTEEEQREAAAKAAQEEIEKQAKAVPSQQQEAAAQKAEDNLAKQLETVAPAAAAPSAATPSVADLQKDLAAAGAEVDKAAEGSPVGSAEVNQWQGSEQAPSMGGTLNATTEQAEQDKRRALEDDRNHTILTHGGGNNYVGDSSPIFQSPLNAASQPPEEQPMVDPFKGETPAPTLNAVTPVSLPPIQPPSPEPSRPAETLADIDRENRAPHEEARAAVDAAFGAVPFSPTGAPQPEQMPAPEQPAAPPAVLPPMPPMPDFSTLPPLPPAADAQAPQTFSGALPPDKLEDVFGSTPAPQNPAPAPQSNDPAQFKIPGQG
ncbi:MAG TPA: hypothetical protein VFS14_01835 [Candidatus Saccharimonadales bacterium]|nr:hypothetical protein [Candidatus Saccharimonadales bacterium]